MKGECKMAIKTHLSRILGERRMKQSELARQTGLQYNTINAVFHDKWEQISRSTLDKICKALGVGISDLIEFADDE